MAIGIYMSASKEIKQAGIKSLAHACRLSGVPRSTVNDWYRTKPKLFRVFLFGIIQIEVEKWFDAKRMAEENDATLDDE